MSLQPGIPWRVALPQSPPPLPRLWTSMQQPLENSNAFLANGNLQSPKGGGTRLGRLIDDQFHYLIEQWVVLQLDFRSRL